MHLTWKCKNAMVNNNNFTENSSGIKVSDSYDGTVTNNTFANSGRGIF